MNQHDHVLQAQVLSRTRRRNIFANEIHTIEENKCACGCCIVTEVARKLTCRRVTIGPPPSAAGYDESGDAGPGGQGSLDDPMCVSKQCTQVEAGSWVVQKEVEYDEFCASFCTLPSAGGTSNAQRTAVNNAFLEGGNISPGNGGATAQAECVDNEDAMALNELQHDGLKAPDYDDSVTMVSNFFGFRR
eukprot:g1903.t1